MNAAFLYINAEFWCWALRHQFNIVIGHRKSYLSRDFLAFPKYGNYPSLLTGREVQEWNSLLSVPRGTRSGKKLIYALFGSTDLATIPSPRSTWNISVVYQHQPSESLDSLLGWQNALSLVGVCMCVCTGHGALHRLIPPHVLWCCLCMLCSDRSILVPNPYLCTSCSGNSKVPHLFPQDRGSSKLLHFVPPTQTFWETTLLLSSPSFSAASQGLWICMCSSHTFSFCPECESFRACGRKDKAAVGYCYAGRCCCARPSMKR